MRIKKSNQSGLKSIGYAIRDKLPGKPIKTFGDLVKKDKTIDYRRLYYKARNNLEYGFTKFSSLGELFKKIYYGEILIPAAERQQDEFGYLLCDLNAYNLRDEEHVSEKAPFLGSMENFYNKIEMVINAFKNKIIPLADGSYSQYFEAEPGEAIIYWVEKPEKFVEISMIIKKEAKNGFNVNFDKSKNISLKKLSRFGEQIKSGKLDNVKDATEWYLKEIYPNKKIIDERTINKDSKKQGTVKEIFNDLVSLGQN